MRLALSFLLFAATAWCQPFPPIEAETLTGKKLSFPGAAAGSPAVVIAGFTHASQSQTMAWHRRLWGEYPRGGPVPVWGIAVLEDVPRLVRGMATHGIRGSVPKEQYDRFLLVFRGEAELKQSAAFDRPDDAYVLLLDSSGAVKWRYHGPPTDTADAGLKAALAAGGK